MAPDYRDLIEATYRRTGNTLGWRFLYSPAKTLEGARVAFLGLNPGGSGEVNAHATYAMDSGSAYNNERWAGREPGESQLQKQVLCLFRKLDVDPERVLAGNIVPFRSPNWASLRCPDMAVQFGKELWTDVFQRARPSLVITMGAQATKIVSKIVDVPQLRKHPTGWGNVSMASGKFSSGRLIGLPHLSRFGIVTRPQSATHLDKLLELAIAEANLAR